MTIYMEQDWHSMTASSITPRPQWFEPSIWPVSSMAANPGTLYFEGGTDPVEQ
jgi:hypothetical protein